MFKFYNKMVLQQSIAVTLNRLSSFNMHAAFASASASIAEAKNHTEEEKQARARRPSADQGSSIVKTVFASIQLQDSGDDIQTPFTDSKLLKAQTVNELLTITDGTGISRKHALQVTSSFCIKTASIASLAFSLMMHFKFQKTIGQHKEISVHFIIFWESCKFSNRLFTFKTRHLELYPVMWTLML